MDSQPFQACGPINKQTEGPWPTDCANFSNATTVAHVQSRNKNN